MRSRHYGEYHGIYFSILDIQIGLHTQKVVPHGQSRQFDCTDDVQVEVELESQQKKSKFRCCCCQKASDDTGKSVLENYRIKSYCEFHSQSLQRQNSKTMDIDEALAAVEEGRSTNDNVCPICLETFNVGDEVAWSKLQYCHHVFHHKCILPWAVLGHVHCPVCREEFWSKQMHRQYCGTLRRNLTFQNEASSLERSKFCVIHGLVSP